MNDIIISAHNLHKVYNSGERRLAVLKGIDLKVEKAEFISIVGPSGAGKSTLLHLLGGLDRPTLGEVILDSQEIYKLKDDERTKIRRQKIAFIFQFYHLLYEFNALENVLLAAILSGKSQIVNPRASAYNLLEEVGLKERLMHRPHQLSGGEQQRVAIARALINEPELLLCDEPTGNLDSENGASICKLLNRLNKEKSVTLVLATHDEQLAKIADRRIYLRDGRIVE